MPLRVTMQESESALALTHARWEVGITGKVIDDRGQAAVDFAQRNTNRLITLEYDPDEFAVDVDGTRINAEDLGRQLEGLGTKSVLLECTTLGFVEIFFCCRSFVEIGSMRSSFLYVEPESYALRSRSQLLHKRDFELSGEVPGYKAIPGATVMLSDRVRQRGVFFLGYEERRLERALEDHQMIQPASCSVVFGVPAFNAGWEMDSFANNIRVIRERNVRGGVYFCGAENPAATVGVLADIVDELASDERLFVAPIGTKPTGIGVALFVATRSDVGILYDHPKRRQGRSTRVARWHLYGVDF
jgi:hypothetical protein